MMTGPLTLYDTALHRFAQGSLRLPVTRLTALLLGGGYTPNQNSHKVLSDLASYEIATGDYKRLQVSGARVTLVPGAAQFTTDDLNWGNPVTLPPVRFLALVEGLATQLHASSPLVGVIDLAPTGTAVESHRSMFTLSPPANGWFEITAASAA